MSKTIKREDTLAKLNALREQLMQVDSKYSTNEAFQRFKAESGASGKITGKVTGKKRGVPKKPKDGEIARVSDRVEHYRRFVKMLQVIPEYDHTVNVDQVKYNLIMQLRKCGYDYALSEFLYQQSYMDVFALQNSRAVEFEIKLCREDYLNDFQKMFFVGSYVNKHSVIAAGECIISKFYFVVPENMIDVRECPAHAGLIWFTAHQDGTVDFRVVKTPPQIHTRFVPPLTYKTILDRVYARCENLIDRYTSANFPKKVKPAFSYESSSSKHDVPGSGLSGKSNRSDNQVKEGSQAGYTKEVPDTDHTSDPCEIQPERQDILPDTGGPAEGTRLETETPPGEL